jgi:hypothetical protein
MGVVRKWLLAGVAACLAFGAAGNVSAKPGQDQGGPITTFYGVNGGPIDPFYGSINPFYGALTPSYGQISPFWGDISPFWGTINPFYGSIQPFYGNIDPFWGTINPFSGSTALSQVYSYWNNAGPQWGNINALWAQLQASNATDYSQLQAQLNNFVATAVSFWGAPAQQFVTQMYAKYGIDPNNPASLANTTAETRSAFFLNFYDSGMNLVKVDHVDWWMAAIHWSPQLVQAAGNGPMLAGLLDAFIAANHSDVKTLQVIGGYKTYTTAHGAAVASLLAAQQEGVGMMGMAPHANVQLYNPFDSTGTASWTDVSNGINGLYNKQTTVVNASLGVPGWTLSNEWGGVMTSPAVNNNKHYFVLVKAAGNEGVTQTANVTWPSGFSAPTNLLMVGSVGPSNQISSFSNTPGEACILVNGACQEQNKLKYRFLVAPGELMLVEDNQGGVTRMTGTSFAAPLVSGTVALLQTRWPWLKNYADETVQIVLQSATDLGAPGVDPVYGWGLLNTQAAMSPLSFDGLAVFKAYTFNGKPISVNQANPNWTPAALKAALQNSAQVSQWQQQKAFLVAYENVGTTYRDFLIPLSSALIGKTQAVNGTNRQFQSYIYQSLLNWAQGTPSNSTLAAVRRQQARKKHH